MAESPTPSNSPKSRRTNVKVPPHPIVAKLKPSVDAPANMVSLMGYFGPSKRDGYMRLYADLSFSCYYEIPVDAIAYAQPTDREDENSLTRVLVPATTQLDVVTTNIQTVQAAYLQGSIVSQYLSIESPFVSSGAPYPVGLGPQTRQGCFTVFWEPGCGGPLKTSNCPPPRTQWTCPIRTLDPPCTVRGPFC